MTRNMFCIKKGGVLFFVFAVLLFSLGIVSAEGESCSSESDCAVGEVCDSGVCTAVCAAGETACSDGVNNDGDEYVDYLGVCTLATPDTPPADFPDCNACDSFEEGTLCGDYCISPERYGAACNALWGSYTQGDSDCVSPLDTTENPPACSDGEDNDDDGYVDYLGTCTLSNPDSPPADFPDCNACDSFEEGTLCGDYCISPERYGTACNALWGSYTQGDSDCSDLIDTSEESEAVLAAPAVEKGFFAWLWDRLLGK